MYLSYWGGGKNRGYTKSIEFLQLKNVYNEKCEEKNIKGG